MEFLIVDLKTKQHVLIIPVRHWNLHDFNEFIVSREQTRAPVRNGSAKLHDEKNLRIYRTFDCYVIVH